MKWSGGVLAAAALLGVYGALLFTVPPGGFYSPDEGAKFLQLHSIGWSRGLTYHVPYGGAALDPTYAFYPTRCRHEDLYPVQQPDGAVKLHWPIWFSLITIPAVSLMGLRGLYVVPLLSGWLIALLSGRLVRIYDRRLSPLAVLAVGLATPVAFFSLTHWEHTLATLLGLAALTMMVAPGAHRRARVAAVPLLLAAIVLRIELVVLAVAVPIAWWVVRPATATPSPRATRRSPWLAAGVLAAALIAVTVVGFLPERHVWLLKETPAYAGAALARLPHLPGTLVAMLIDASGNRAPELSEALRIGALLVFAALVAAPFAVRPQTRTAVGVVAGFLALDFSAWLGVLPEPYISLHGLFPVAPFTALAAWAVADAWRTRRPDHLMLAIATSLYLFLGIGLLFTFAVESDGTYRTGLEWGNRYLLTFYPLATVLALGGIAAWRRSIASPVLRRIVTVVVLGLFLCGAQMQARGLSVLYHSRTLVTAWQAALQGDGPIVTDVWWLPAAMAPLFAARAVYCVRDPTDLADWLAGAHARGVEEFTFASFRDLPAARLSLTALTLEDTTSSVVSGLHIQRYRISTAKQP